MRGRLTMSGRAEVVGACTGVGDGEFDAGSAMIRKVRLAGAGLTGTGLGRTGRGDAGLARKGLAGGGLAGGGLGVTVGAAGCGTNGPGAYVTVTGGSGCERGGF
jgi:hypothetical protein